ncbi:MAG: nucleoside-triphosphatase [Anaerolineaceae bacterium]|nr:nucleoside-triphosphatase [Anaerolineaceae bacterium]
MPDGKRFILSGEREIGKTTLLLALKEQSQKAGFDVSGVISPAVFEAGSKTGIDLLDLRSGKQIRLANLNKAEPDSQIATIHWAFDEGALQYGNEVLGRATPCDLLIVDELGPIELVRGQGWQNGIQAIESKEYKAAVIVIRPSLLDVAFSKWSDATLLTLEQKDPAQQATLVQSIISSLK